MVYAAVGVAGAARRLHREAPAAQQRIRYEPSNEELCMLDKKTAIVTGASGG